MSTFFLLVRDEGREPPRRIPAVAGMSIGRAPDNQCVLGDPNVGRKAARIVEERGVFFVEDLGSTNRTGIRGGRKLGKGEREALRHGLVIEVGKSALEIEEERAADEATSPGDATNPAAGENTLVGSPSAFLTADDPRTLQAEDFDRTLRPATPRPARAPAPSPAPLRARLAEPPAPASAPVPTEPPPAPPEARPEPRPEPHVEPRAAIRRGETGPSPSSTADFLGGGGTLSMRPVTGEFGAIAAMITRRPRLVIVNEALRRIDLLEKQVTLIGRESGDLVLDHKAISQPHALIRYVDELKSFQIEDRKSKNQTFVGSLALNPETPQPLTPECLVRFGPLEAVFVVDLDDENAKIPEACYANAVRHLRLQNQITVEQARAALEEAKQGTKHVGEALLMAGAISAKTWTRAFELGKLAPPSPPAKSGRRLWIVVFVLLVAALAVAYAFRAELGWTP